MKQYEQSLMVPGTQGENQNSKRNHTVVAHISHRPSGEFCSTRSKIIPYI